MSTVFNHNLTIQIPRTSRLAFNNLHNTLRTFNG